MLGGCNCLMPFILCLAFHYSACHASSDDGSRVGIGCGVCGLDFMTISVSSVVMSGTLGPRHARGSLVLFFMSVFACAVMLGLPVRCAVAKTASLGNMHHLACALTCVKLAA